MTTSPAKWMAAMPRMELLRLMVSHRTQQIAKLQEEIAELNREIHKLEFPGESME